MSITKNPYIRYQTLDRCFRNPGRNYFIEDLLEECNRAIREVDPDAEGIKKRQLFDDIRFLESEQGGSIPLERHRFGKRIYYRYSDLNFSIKNQPLNQLEGEHLKSAILVLSRIKGLPQFSWINELIPKLESVLKFEAGAEKIMSFESNVYIKGIENLGLLFNAILYKKVLSISYKPFKFTDSILFQFHPYYLKQYNNRWFIYGLNSELKKIYNLALDRIESISEISQKYIENTSVDFEEYFEDVIGVTVPEDKTSEIIKLWFSPETAPYVLTKPLHGSQRKIRNDESGLEISIDVIPNHELEQLVLSFGKDCKVLSPKTFVDRIKNVLNKSLANY
ncbi:helix-turn-helix transcriptional regulator [Maribellus mangrovi]|uniref:helix-turn-helix transcriptional regulator n=1 Tax=Maribellus mangrovi TaxID=3133146 RepID=UPI0030ED2F5A